MLKAYLFAGAALLTTITQAAVIEREFSGNDCSGFFGSGFDSCTVFVNHEGETIPLSPVIAKYGADLSSNIQTNTTVYPSIDGSEFTFPVTSAGNRTGTWAYNPDNSEDPGTRYWATKAGNSFLLHWSVDDSELLAGGACDVSDYYTYSCINVANVVGTGTWSTPDDKELSHITFYDTAVVPVPAAVWLFASGLIGLAGFSQRKKLKA